MIATRMYPKPVPVTEVAVYIPQPTAAAAPPVVPPPKPPQPLPPARPRPRVTRAKPSPIRYGVNGPDVWEKMANWYFQNRTSHEEVWEKNEHGNLLRPQGLITIRRKMVTDLCIKPDIPSRVSPGDIARYAGVNHSTLFSLAQDVREKLPTSNDRPEAPA
jgi:hypothetical protein